MNNSDRIKHMSNRELLLYDSAYMYALGKSVGQGWEAEAEYFRSMSNLIDAELRLRLGVAPADYAEDIDVELLRAVLSYNSNLIIEPKQSTGVNWDTINPVIQPSEIRYDPERWDYEGWHAND